PNTTVVIAKQSIPLRHQITASDLETAKMSVNGNASLTNTYPTVGDVVNLISEINITKGTVLTSDMLAKDINLVPAGSAPAYLPLAKGFVAMTIPTGEMQGVAGHISVGDYITVIASASLTTFNATTQQQQGPTRVVSKTVFTNLRIIGLGPASAGVQPAAGGGQTSTGGPTSGATPYAPQASIPVAQPAAGAPAPSLSQRGAAAGGELTPAFTAAKVQIHAKLIEKFADEIDSSNKPGVREKILELAEEYFRSTAMTMTKNDKERLVDSVLDDVLGLGPLEALLADPNITEIMANHPKQIYVEKSGEPILSSVTFESERQMRQVIDRIVSLVGRRVDESTPICDARLKDGSRVNV